jgi:hypothetical protein
MSNLFLLSALLMTPASAFFLSRLTAPRQHVEGTITFSLALVTVIILVAYALSAFTLLDAPSAWALATAIALALSLSPALSARGRALLFRRPSLDPGIERRLRHTKWHHPDIWLLAILAGAVAIVIGAGFFLAIGFEPATPDAHAYHLPRVIYFLQQGNLHFFESNYWNISAYPRIATILQLFAFVTSGQSAGLTQLVQLFAFLFILPTLYGICRELGAPRRNSLFAALIFGVLTICVTEAATAQNDLILTFFIAATVYYLVAYRATRRVRLLPPATLALALALGVKATVLIALPGVLIITLFALWPLAGEMPARWWRTLGITLASLAIAVTVITLPSGYLDNWRHFHDPFGPTEVRKRYTQEGRALNILARGAGYNVLRYTVEFMEPDGLPPLPGYEYAHWLLMLGPRTVLDAVHLNLEGPYGTRVGYPFKYARPTIANENTSSWGLTGLLLIIPVVLLALLGFIRAPGVRAFALAALAYHLTAALLMLYDPFHGRFYTTAAVFALPPLAFINLRPRAVWKQTYLVFAILIAAITGFNAALFRDRSSFVPVSYRGRTVNAVFGYGRTTELVREAPSLLPVMIETYIDDDATVYLDTSSPFPEYFLFGERFSRHVVPLHPFWGERRPLPPDARYLIYDARSPYFRVGKDLKLTDESYPFGVFYLRMLDKTKGRPRE